MSSTSVKNRSWARAAALVICMLMAACSKTPLQQKEDAFMAAYEAAKPNIVLLGISEDSYRNWLSRSLAGFYEQDKVRAERDYQELALKGAAGSKEQLIAAGRLMDNPHRLADMEKRARAHGDPSEALKTAMDREAEYRRDARSAMTTWLPPLARAAQEYRSEYKSNFEAWMNDTVDKPALHEQSRSVKDALQKVEELYAKTKTAVELEDRERLEAERNGAERKNGGK
jgi:hypothetical protein